MRSQGETPSGRILGASENRLLAVGDSNSTAIDRQKRATARLRAAIRADLCDRLDQTSGRILGTQPVSYAMTAEQITTHAHELQRVHHWQPWEIRARLTNPKQVAA